MNEKQENFKRIAENRFNKILAMVSSLENLTNKSYYEYSDDQADAVFCAIQEQLDRTRAKFSEKKKRRKRFRF